MIGEGENLADGYSLYVAEGILAEKLKLALTTAWPDYVFEEDYNLSSLQEVADHLKKNKHLPNVPSAKEVEEKGVDMVEMNAVLLRQIEELWLHLIEMKKENEELRELIKKDK